MIYAWYTFLLLAATAFVVLPSLWLMEEDRGWFSLLWLFFSLPLVVGLTFVLFVDDNEDGVHEWRGGAGPATVCEYQVRSETNLVAKVPVSEDVVYTVCRDPG